MDARRDVCTISILGSSVFGKIFNCLYSQEIPFKRIALLRISLSVVCLIYVILDTNDVFYVRTSAYLYKPSLPLPFVPALGTNFYLLKYCIVFVALVVLVGFHARIFSVFLAALYFVYGYYTSNFSTYWSYTTHINFFLIALCCVDSSRYYSLDALMSASRQKQTAIWEQEAASFAISFMQIYVAVLYLQAGTSKFLHSGLRWYSTGQTLYLSIMTDGTMFGRLVAEHPSLFPILAVITGCFELGFLPFFFFKRYRAYLAVAAISFHTGTYLLMGISFWYLWFLYPALFIFGVRSTINKD